MDFKSLDFIIFDFFWLFLRISSFLQVQVVVGILFWCLEERKCIIEHVYINKRETRSNNKA